MITATTTTTAAAAAAVNDKTIIQIAKPYTELLFNLKRAIILSTGLKIQREELMACFPA